MEYRKTAWENTRWDYSSVAPLVLGVSLLIFFGWTVVYPSIFYRDRGTDMQFNVVERIMIERFATETNETNAGGRAFVGALIGGVVGVPTAGAVIGAAGGKVQRNIRPGFICQFTVRYNNTLYRYSGTYTFGWKPDPGVLACATLRDGDQIRIFTNVQEDTLREKILSSAVYWQAGVSEEVPLR